MMVAYILSNSNRVVVEEIKALGESKIAVQAVIAELLFKFTSELADWCLR